jgi:hypothetical protein
MLTQAQARDYNRAKRLETYLSENASVVTGYVPFADEVALFNNNIQELEGYIQNKNGTGKGVTSSKTTLKRGVADRLAIVCTTTKAYAVKYNNSGLAAQMDFNATDIIRQKDADVLPFTLHAQE